MPTYEDLGASHQKEDVHAALKDVDQGLYPNAFCKISPDIAGDENYCSLVHADGAGTKSSLAYMMYKETGDLIHFKNIVKDAINMNIDDVLCVGAGMGGIESGESLLLSNTIGREKKLISKEIIAAIIKGYNDFIKKLQELGLPITSCGGETADVGDLVRTIIMDATLVARMKRENVIIPKRIENNDVIVGLASYGHSSYEEIEYNSGIGSNGLTLARHGLLDHQYYGKYPECYSTNLDESLVFFGKHSLHDKVPNTPLTVGEAILSPTRTYAPIILNVYKKLKELYPDEIIGNYLHAMYHNTGGGQSKCMKFGKGIHYIKDDMFPVPPFFKLIQESSQTEWKEMYHVFNMGHRMEIICPENIAKDIILPISQKFEVDAKIVGRVEKDPSISKNSMTLSSSVCNFSI